MALTIAVTFTPLVGMSSKSKYKNFIESNDMHEAICRNDIEAVKKYLDNNGDPNLTYNNLALIHIAILQTANIDIIKLLIAHGANVNLKRNSISPLDSAIIWNKTEIAELLIASNADVNGLDDLCGSSPIQKVLTRSNSKHRLDMLHMLLNAKNINANQPDAYGQTPFWTACATGDLQAVKILSE